MKKLLKAVALATVMCLLLSTAAFAAEFGTATGDKASKYITADVIGAGAGNEVVLLIVGAGVAPAAADDADIMFIDQKMAGTDGAAKFENILIKDDETVVDVYVGSKDTKGAQLIGEDIDLKKVTEMTIVTNAVVEATEDAETTRGYAAAISVVIPDGLTATKMIWGFQVAGETNRRYSSVQNIAGATGAVQYAASFYLGYSDAKLAVSDVSAIFLATDGEDSIDLYTDMTADKGNKAPVVAE